MVSNDGGPTVEGEEAEGSLYGGLLCTTECPTALVTSGVVTTSHAFMGMAFDTGL